MNHRIHVLCEDQQAATHLASDLEGLGHRVSWCVGSAQDCAACLSPSRCGPAQHRLTCRLGPSFELTGPEVPALVAEESSEAIFCEIAPLLFNRMISMRDLASGELQANAPHLVVVSWLGSGPDVLAFSESCGASGVLAAPWTPEELSSVVEAVFSRSTPVERQTSETLLVVEDDSALLELILAVLGSAGYHVTGAGTAEAALSVAIREKPILLLTDNCLPGVQGVSLIQRFRSLFPTAATILFTSFGDEGLARAALLAGVDDYLPKPLNALALLAVVGRAIKRRNFRSFESYLHQHHRELARTVVALHEREQAEVRLHAELLQAEKLSTVGALISGVAHELNNPLAVIVGFLDLALDEPGCPDGLRGTLERVREAGMRCTSIVQDLLGLVRKSTGRFRLVDLHEPIESIVRLRGRQLALEGIELVTDLDRELPQLLSDVPRLLQVLLNLVNNAADAMSEGQQGSTIRIRTRGENGAAVVSVHDDGPSIPAGVAEHIFEPFFTTKAPGKGTGLGLSISRDIVESLGGELTLANGPDGVTFTFTVPFQAKEQAPDIMAAEPSSQIHSFAGARLLIVDDEPDIIQLLRRILVAGGAEVQSATGGDQAISLLERGSFDLIVCDLKMPGTGGVEVYQYLQGHRPELAERMLFASGDTASEVTRGFLDEGIVPVLQKPYGRAAVLEAVGSALRRLGERSLALDSTVEQMPQPSGLRGCP